tara:strand:- start:2701 stop:3066 length:366 start_codon:yes stop_codon:yes gene_type:complete
MTTLLPNTNAQIISIIPRSYVVASDLTLKIIEDGTKKNQSLTGLTSALSSNGNFLNISCTFSILAEDGNYSFEIKQGTTLLYRGKAYATSQVDYTTSHTLNSGKYNEYVGGDTNEQKYIVI